MATSWPAGRLPTMKDPQLNYTNHKGAVDHQEALIKYVQKEQQYKAVMGPYKHIPFSSRVGISPLSTRAKKNSEDRRIILDLSFPPGDSVNDGILKDNYLGFQTRLTFPKVDEFAFRIYSLGKGCSMFKVDLSRYFRQIPLDPGDYSLIGYLIQGEIYFDKVLPMGMRSAPYITQRLSNAIAYIIRNWHFFILNYVDDCVGAEVKEKIWQAFNKLIELLQEINVETAKDKIIPPHNKVRILGNNI